MSSSRKRGRRHATTSSLASISAGPRLCGAIEQRRQLVARLADTIAGWPARAATAGARRTPRRSASSRRTRCCTSGRRSTAPPGSTAGSMTSRRARPGSSTRSRTRSSRSSGLAKTEGRFCGSGDRHEPVTAALVRREPRPLRRRFGLGVVREGLRLVRRRHRVGWEDAARGNDGHPRRGFTPTSWSSSAARPRRSARRGR